ncbi:pyrimidine reductase family protein [Actinorugispora endophytica]|uniref:Riboflavin biosynthesis pyrimidine reductase n=1 Tax=Actinorugispora endophytica TaxID=1605990 RepID=A0A4R6V0U6_9ACTN|nr:pyrimidine reductase family protein [Actinorugispora endophytica]TDQ49624.1 riboflavin biosynthesis pyrimidine reductase [Actinorugispora endophytica]
MSSSTAPPPITRLLPAPSGPVDLAEHYAYPAGLDRPWLRANMVASADGGAWGPSGRSRDLSGPADRAVLGVLRGLADVVLAGAGTARTEGYRPVRPREVWAGLRAGRAATPPIAVVTRSMDLDPGLLADAPDDARTIVFTTESAPAERRRAAAEHADVVVVGADSVDPASVLAALAERGLHRVLTEGGPHLLGALVAADVLDELCLTLSPTLVGPHAARVVAGTGPATARGLRLASLAESDGSLFMRYTRP